MADTAPAPTALPYATPATRAGSPVAAGVWIAVAGLVLVAFGGCFCVGVMLLVKDFGDSSFAPQAAPQAVPLTQPQEVLICVLYACAAACFVAGAWVFILGLRRLVAVTR